MVVVVAVLWVGVPAHCPTAATTHRTANLPCRDTPARGNVLPPTHTHPPSQPNCP